MATLGRGTKASDTILETLTFRKVRFKQRVRGVHD